MIELPRAKFSMATMAGAICAQLSTWNARHTHQQDSSFLRGKSLGVHGYKLCSRRLTESHVDYRHLQIKRNVVVAVSVTVSESSLESEKTAYQKSVSDSFSGSAFGDLDYGTLQAPSLPNIDVAKRVVLVRHGESTWNATGRIQGSSDFSVLTAKGNDQAETSRLMLSADKFDVCFHSPLQRSARTAEIIWGARDAPMVPLHDLREIDLYSFQGLLKEEGKAKYGAQFSMWQKDAANFEIDKHYPVRELWERASSCWEDILSHPGGRSILVVAHNAVNQALVATATGLGPEYFRQLLQSNCGVSVLDFTPRRQQAGAEHKQGGPYVCLNRLNQTPSPPVGAAGASGAGRKAKDRVILLCHGATDSSTKKRFATSDAEDLNMLGIIQSRKTAELLLDVPVDTIITSPLPRARKTAEAIAEVQEGAHCLTEEECEMRYVDVVELAELRDFSWGAWRGMLRKEIAQGQQQRLEDTLLLSSPIDAGESLSSMWERAGAAWQAILERVAQREETENEDPTSAQASGKTVVVVGHPMVFAAMLGHCLGLSQIACLGSFLLDAGSLNVIDFPDGPLEGKGIVRCLNYTAHLGRWAVPVTRSATVGDDDVY
eukprot:TRINITY_DN38507_c0_g1_i1.p1 TRINITY_DN38507_c0_g1~~TRINITY_DN38507_c0_g1_i1.p1  ORF type:complete len:603 (+),score=73.93 TRINITY_DN38507_c0_g1_i1:124-1932(+)